MRGRAFILMVCLCATAAHSSPGVMAVDIEYSPFWDSLCALLKGYEIKESWKKELKEKSAELASDWNVRGRELLIATEDTVGKKFERTSVTVHLTLCNTPSRSFPVIVNMRYSLSSFTDRPVPIFVKTGTIYHEILHPYVERHLQRQSRLIERYANEHPRVVGHLHVLALLKAVYLKLQLADQLSTIIDIDGRLPGGYYKRAWEIVNSDPAYYLEFVRELQGSGS